ncbi:RidA family protein [Pseudonocardia xinjiangensis]|uniref:RidA family protein n=1 Tax=Pseudonocardia xinjiangensis TaxID=75289 RepID=A0ABX1R7Z3_9PSEU|nr:Rid family hydrolase [Pseudonocardia xinjiangensis]NMH76482.1 RidA family protein [Pseudonocardia xinjiangensis]
MSTTRKTESHGVPWETKYGYVQAVQHRDTIYISGQVAHDGSDLVAPAPTDADGRVTDTGNTAAQMRQCYANAARLLARFGASLEDVVDEVLYVVDIEAADAAAGPVRKEAYGRPDPQVASTMIGIPRLAFRELLVEIKLVARV